jgi:hypothetical protein
MAMVKCKECGTEISSSATNCPKCGAPRKKRWGTSLFTWLVVIVLVVGFFVAVSGGDNERSATAPAVAKPKTPSAYELAKQGTTLDFKWRKAGFDNVLEVDFNIKNGSVVTVKDIAITCILYAKSGTQVDANRRTIHDVIRPGETKKFPKFNMGLMHTQAHSASCYIASLALT